MRHRPRLLVGIVLLLALVVSGFLSRSWLAAQGRAFVVLVSAVEVPVLGWAVRVITDEPRFEETELAGVPATVVRPGGGVGPWPALVFMNGVTARGRHHPSVRRLAGGLARAGYVVFVPDLHGLARGEITERTSADGAAASLAAATSGAARGGRVALVGVSIGTALALLAAEAPALAGRVSLVAGVAPYAELREVMRLATTGHHRLGRRLLRYRPDPFVGLVVARSLAAGLPAGRGRDRLREHVLAVDDDDNAPLAALPQGLEGPAGAVVAVLDNRDPARFDALYAALPGQMRDGIESLSPLGGAHGVAAPVELASAPRDKYFPLSDSRRLAAAAPRGRLTVTETLDHAVPSASFHDIADLVRFYGFLLRTLQHVRQG